MAYNQFVLGDWGLSGVTACSQQPGLPLAVGEQPASLAITRCGPTTARAWSQVTHRAAPGRPRDDLTFDGTYYSFTLTGSGGTGLGFGGYDYAVVGTPTLAGDVNLDGRVDINDLTIVLANYGQAGKTWTQGSIDGDPTGTVDINDLTIVLASYNSSVARRAASASAPCPSRRACCCWPPAWPACWPTPGAGGSKHAPLSFGERGWGRAGDRADSRRPRFSPLPNESANEAASEPPFADGSFFFVSRQTRRRRGRENGGKEDELSSFPFIFFSPFRQQPDHADVPVPSPCRPSSCCPDFSN